MSGSFRLQIHKVTNRPPVNCSSSNGCNSISSAAPTASTSRMVSAREATTDLMATGILERLRDRGRAFPNHGGDKTKASPFFAGNRLRLTGLRFRFPDKFGRGHELWWGKAVDLATGQEYPVLCNLKHWPDPHYFELAVDGHIAVETDVNFVRVCGWDRQPDDLKQLVIDRLQDPDFKPIGSPSLVLEEEEPSSAAPIEEVPESPVQKKAVVQVESQNSPMHPCIPAMNQIIAAVGREAKTSGLVAAGYVFVDPEVFFET